MAKRGRPTRDDEPSGVRVVFYVSQREAGALDELAKQAGNRNRNEYARDLAVTEAGDQLESGRK